MRIVTKPSFRPMHCAVLPYIGQMTNCRWVDTEMDLGPDELRVYLSEPGVQEAAKLLGMPTRAELAQLRAENQQLKRMCDETNLALIRLQQQLDAVHVLKSTKAFRAERKPGPKAQVEA